MTLITMLQASAAAVLLAVLYLERGITRALRGAA